MNIAVPIPACDVERGPYWDWLREVWPLVAQERAGNVQVTILDGEERMLDLMRYVLKGVVGPSAIWGLRSLTGAETGGGVV